MPPRDNLMISDIIFDGHNWGERNCYRHLIVEAGDTTKHPTVHRITPLTKNYLAQNVNNAEVEKPWSIPTHCLQTNALQGCTFPLSRCPSTKKKKKKKRLEKGLWFWWFEGRGTALKQPLLCLYCLTGYKIWDERCFVLFFRTLNILLCCL